MATRSESLNGDLISALPEEIKHLILECLPTYEVARTSVLSKQWNDVWLRHNRLVFNDDLYCKCVSDAQGKKRLAVANIIYDVLLRRTGLIKKFTLEIIDPEYAPKQNDLDRWCLILSRNGVEELNLLLFHDCTHFRLPFCIFSCKTIKQLNLRWFKFNFPLNFSCIFPNVTTLLLEFVLFSEYDLVSTIPNLEKIGLMNCIGFNKLKFSAPKLESMDVLCYNEEYEGEDKDQWEWVKLYWNTIKTISLSADWFVDCFYFEPEIPTAMNLQTLELYQLNLESGKAIALAMQLLRKTSNLCQLEIYASHSTLGSDVSDDHKEVGLRVLEDPDNWSINQNLEKLHTVKINSFVRTELGMLLVKTLLSKSPALDKLIITSGWDINASEASKMARELLSLPRASQKAQVDFIMCYP